MSGQETNYKLPRNIEHYLATLSKLYAQEGKKKLQEIIVNSQIRVHEEWSYDDWNGGTYGHAVYLILPEVLFLNSVKQKDVLENHIRDDLNKIHNIQNEYIEKIFFEMEMIPVQDWRKESGLLLSGERFVLPEVENRIWGSEGYRVFISHKSEVKKETSLLKEKLRLFGITGFVAHEDIHPTKEWQDEIENAICSMDALLALMTEGFHDSIWTDQEIGFAFGRGVPIVSVRLGRDPYGFIGKFQALPCTWDTAPKELAKIFIKQNRAVSAYIKAIQNCHNFDQANMLSELLPLIEKTTAEQVREITNAFRENSQIYESFGFNGKKGSKYGQGLPYHLKRLTGLNYELTRFDTIEVVS